MTDSRREAEEEARKCFVVFSEVEVGRVATTIEGYRQQLRAERQLSDELAVALEHIAEYPHSDDYILDQETIAKNALNKYNQSRGEK